MDNIDKFVQLVQESDNIVFFGGAGVSTESGIPDFRSPDGLYNQKYKYPPETIISHSFYQRYPEEFYRFYKDKMLYPDAKPGITHLALARLEKEGKLKAVITQNIDGLHQKAGSSNVIELHGSVLRNYCERCHKFYGIDKIINSEGVPMCDCGGRIKPDVVLYEEGLQSKGGFHGFRYIGSVHFCEACRFLPGWEPFQGYGTMVPGKLTGCFLCRNTLIFYYHFLL